MTRERVCSERHWWHTGGNASDGCDEKKAGTLSHPPVEVVLVKTRGEVLLFLVVVFADRLLAAGGALGVEETVLVKEPQAVRASWKWPANYQLATGLALLSHFCQHAPEAVFSHLAIPSVLQPCHESQSRKSRQASALTNGLWCPPETNTSTRSVSERKETR